MRVICWSPQVPKACPVLMTHQVWKPPESQECFKGRSWYITLQESWSSWSRWPCIPFPAVEGTPLASSPGGTKIDAVIAKEIERAKARSGTQKTHLPWQHLQVQDHTTCDAITLFLTSHLHWNWPRNVPTQPDTFPCQVNCETLKTICW